MQLSWKGHAILCSADKQDLLDSRECVLRRMRACRPGTGICGGQTPTDNRFAAGGKTLPVALLQMKPNTD